MRPVRLVMSAFGSYAGKQEIDFTKADQGVFLVTGDTGAGKTTIFDAITYALYDQTSGGRRDGNMMRSHYADLNAETYVEFEFEYRDSRYRIFRNPEYERESKRRDREGNLKKTVEKSKVVLYLPDGMEFIGTKSETNKKIVEIIGLDAGQFRQIAMIAQGEFLRLLLAKSDERKEIFSRLFNTEVYAHIQKKLREQAKALYGRIMDEEKAKERELQHIRYPEEDTEEEGSTGYRERIQGERDLSVIADILKEMLAEGKAKERELAKKEKELQEQADRLNEKLALAEENNNLLYRLKEAREELDSLKEQEEKFKAQEKRLREGEAAGQVVREENNFKEKQVTVTKLKKELEELTGNLKIKEKEQCRKKEDLIRAKQEKETLEPKCRALISRIEVLLPTYKELEQLDEELKKALKVKEMKEEAARRIRGEKESLTLKIEQLDSSIKEKKNSGDVLREVKGAREKQETVYQALRNLEGRIPLWRQAKEKIDIVQNELLKADAAYAKSYEDYSLKNDTFFREQAGILAAGLGEGSPCPVCGSTNHPAPARLSGTAPSQEDVRTAKEARDEAEKKRDEVRQCFMKEKQKLDAGSEILLYEGRKIFGEQFSLDENWIGERISQCTREAKEKTALLRAQEEKAREDEEAYEKNRREREEASAAMAEKSGQLQAADMEQHDSMLKYHNLLQKKESVKEQLPYPDKDMALKIRQDNRNLLVKIYGETEEREKLYQDCQREFLSLTGEKSAKEQEFSKALETLKNSENIFRTALMQAGFADEEEYREKKLAQNEQEEMKSTLHAYREKLIEAAAGKETWAKAAQGKQLIDTGLIKEEKERVLIQKKDVENSLKKIYSGNENNREVREHLKKIWEQTKEMQSRYEVLRNLDQTANGNLSGSAKIDFESYVQRQYFGQVIHYANQRLLKMTSSQFILQCRTLDALGNKGSAGLDLDVYSMVTGTVRDVKTLSGGESFMAALAMALGMADVIKRSAGGIQLKMMFVDEGFGSLDEYSREQAVEVLGELAGTDRMIGIISHVTELKESIERQLLVTKGKKGSEVKWSS